jgi:hypothetical protein
LTASAARSAARCDAVSLGRTLALASVGCEPAEAYLRPDVELVEWARRRVPATSIGLVWRSELNDPMRTIHYVDVPDLAPLAKLDGHFVCLQHDVDETERHELNHTFPGRIVFLDDVDLRNDFERAAAIVSVCGQVVGVGTTMTELAAAVGTPTVTMIPNAMGAWRGLGGRDHWHRSATIVSAPHPRAQRACVERALDVAVRR